MTQPLSDVASKPKPRGLVLEVPEEGPPIACNLGAGAFSLLLLASLEFVATMYVGEVSPTLENTWLLLLDLLPFGTLMNAALGAIVLTVLAISLQLLQRAWRFSDSLPLILAWPAAFLLVAPSAFEHSDDWAPWMVLGGLAAFVFCCHWLAFLLARETWD